MLKDNGQLRGPPIVLKKINTVVARELNVIDPVNHKIVRKSCSIII